MKVHMRFTTKEKVRCVRRKIVATMLSTILLCNVIVQPTFVNATSAEPPAVNGIDGVDGSDGMGEQQPSTVIVEFESLSGEISSQSIEVNDAENLNFPTRIGATLEDDSAIEVDVEWTSTPSFDIATGGTYIYQSALAEGSAYTVQDGVILPSITVTVVPKEVNSITTPPAENPPVENPPADTPPSEGEENKKALKVMSFTALEDDIVTQNIELNSDDMPVLPETINVVIEGESEAKDIDITWATDSTFDVAMEGKYTYTAVLTEGYELGTDVELPVIEVVVGKVAENADGHAPMPTSGGEPALTAGDLEQTTITSTTFKDYNSDGSLWNYTSDSSLMYTVEYFYKKPITEDRIFTIDINPSNMENFPFRINESGVALVDGATIAFDDNNTLLTYTIPNDSDSFLLDTGTGKFTITLSLIGGSGNETAYQGSSGTAAAAVGNTLLTNAKNNKPTEFGVTLDDNIESGVEVIQRHIPNLYNLDWDVSVEEFIGTTTVTGGASGNTYKIDQIGTEKGVYGLWLASNGDIYFGDGTTFENTNSTGVDITTPIISVDHLPIGDFTYEFYNTLNTHVKEGETGTIETIVGSTSSLTETFGHGESAIESPFTTTFGANELSSFEGSLKVTNNDGTAVNKSISFGIEGIKYNLGDNYLEDLQDDEVKYITTSGVKSKITYNQLVVSPGVTDSKSDDTYSIAIREAVIPSVVINIPSYTTVDRLDTYPASGKDGIVGANTSELRFNLKNIFEQDNYSPDAVVTRTYAGHTLTIEIPDNVTADTFSTYGDTSEERYFSHYQTVTDDIISDKIATTWNDKGQLYINNLQKVDKLILHISGTGIFSGVYTNEGIQTSNRYENYDREMGFTGCVITQPEGEVDSETNRYPMPMEIYLSDSTGKRLSSSEEDDLTINWHYEVPKITDMDNLKLNLASSFSRSTSKFGLNDYNDSDTVYTAYIQPWYNGNLYYDTDSRVFKDVEIDFTTGQETQLQLIKEVRIFTYLSGGGETFAPIPEGAIVKFYYTTNTNPEERVETYSKYSWRYSFKVKSGQYLTSLRIVIDKMQLKALMTDSLVKGSGFKFMEIDMNHSPTLENGDIPIIDVNDDGKFEDTLTIDMNSTLFDAPKQAEATTIFSYTRKTANLKSVPNTNANTAAEFGQENKTLSAETTLYFNIEDTQIDGNEELINSKFPQGSAVYLKLNPAYFEYVGPETETLTRVTGAPTGTETEGAKWLRIDITGKEGEGSVTIPSGTILVTEEIPESETAGVPLFLAAYLDTNPLLGIDYLENGVVDYVTTLSGISAPEEITIESNTTYGITEADGLIGILDSNGHNPTVLKVKRTFAITAGMSAIPRINEGGHLELGTEKVIRYYAHESDDLELGIILSTEDEATNKTVTIVLPDDDAAMKIELRGDIYKSLLVTNPELLIERNNITYYDDINASSLITAGTSGIDYSLVKSVKIVIPSLKENSITVLPIQLKAAMNDVYTKMDDTEETVIAYSDLVSSSSAIEVKYIFDWYELSGISYTEKENQNPNGIFDGKDEYFDVTGKGSFNGVASSYVSYDGKTNKYTILVQPKAVPYTIVYAPTDTDTYTNSTNMPTAPDASLTLNNNYNGSTDTSVVSGIQFNADIVNGLSPVIGVGQNLKQVEFDNGNVDLALNEKVYYYTVYFVEVPVDATNTDNLIFKKENVESGSTVSQPTADNLATYTPPEGKKVVGWEKVVNTVTGTTGDEWIFGTGGTVVLGDVYLSPILEDIPKVTFKVIDPYLEPDKELFTNTITVIKGEKPTEPSITLPTEYQTGYKLTNQWYYYDAETSIKVDITDPSTYVVDGDITFIQEVVKEYTVTFEAGTDKDTIDVTETVNDDFTSTDNDTVTIKKWDGETLDITPSTTPNTTDGFVFDKWYVDKNTNGQYDDGEEFTSVTVDKNITVNAHYVEGITITFDALEGKDIIDNTITPNDKFTVSDNGQTATIETKKGDISPEPITTDNADDDYEFDFWYVDNNSNGIYDETDVKYSSTEPHSSTTTYIASYKLTAVAYFLYYDGKSEPSDLSNVRYFSDDDKLLLLPDGRIVADLTNNLIIMDPVSSGSFQVENLDQNSYFTTMLTVDQKIVGWKLHYINNESKIEYLKDSEGKVIQVDKSADLLTLGELEVNYKVDLGGEMEYVIFIHPVINTTNPDKLIVKFDEDGNEGGTIHEQKNNIDPNTTITLPDDNTPISGKGEPDKWTTLPNGKGDVWWFDNPKTPDIDEGTPVVEDVILYPYWEHKVEFDEDGESGGTIHETKDNIPDKDTVTLPDDNTPMTGKGEPDKWTTKPGGKGDEWEFDDPKTPDTDEGTPVVEDVILYPYWEHKVEFDEDGKSGGTIYETKDNIPDKDTVTLPDDNNPMTGKGEPDKWTTEPNGGGVVWEFDNPSTPEKEGTPVVEDVILYPYWEPEVTPPNPGDGGTPTPPTPPAPPTPPTPLTPPTTPTTPTTPDEEIEVVVDEEVDDTPDETEETDEPEVEDEEGIVEDPLTIQPPVTDKEIEKVTVDGTDLGEEDYSIDESGNLVLSPEFLATLPDGAHKIEIEVDGENYETVLVMKNGIPLSIEPFTGAGGKTRWSLFDLLSTIFVALSAIYVAFIKKRKKDDEDEENWDAFDRKYDEIEDEKFAKLRRGKTIALVVEAVMAIILLFITQDFIHMVIFDEYSIAFALSVILAIILVMMASKKPREDDEEMTIAAKVDDYQKEHEEDVKKLRMGKIVAIIVDVLLIAVMFYVTRLGSTSLFAIDRFTIIFVLCVILIGTIIPIKNSINEDEIKNI